MKKKIIIYTRFSTIGQGIDSLGRLKEDHSGKVQADRCLAHLKHVVSNIDEYEMVILEDIACSGSNTKRPSYKKMEALIKSGAVKAVTTTELSRISRSTIDFFKFIELCELYGVQVIIVGQNLDTKSAQGKMLMTIMISFAQMEREQTIERQKHNNYSRLIKDGKINGGTEILGLKTHEKKSGVFVKDDKTLKVLVKVLNIYLDSLTRSEAINKIADLGIKNINGKKITLSVLDNILKNCHWRYKGKWYANLENKDKDQSSLRDFERYTIVELPHGQILSDVLIKKVLEKQKLDSTNLRQTGSNGYVYLLSSILFDEKGDPFKGEAAHGKGGSYRYYRNTKTGDRLKVNEIDSLVMTTLRSYIANDNVFQESLDLALNKSDTTKSDLQIELSSIDGKLRSVSNKEEKLRSSLLDDDADLTSWFKEEIKKVVQEKKQLELRKVSIQEYIRKLDFDDEIVNKRNKYRTELENLAHLKKSQLRNFVELMIDKVIVKKNNEIEIRFLGEKLNFEPVLKSKKGSELNENGGNIVTVIIPTS